MSELILRGVSVLGRSPCDLAVKDDRFVDLGDTRDAAVANCSGLIALPGLVDVHTHLREPGREDAETISTGSAAAARGGYVAVCAMANTSPVADTPEIVEQVSEIGRQCGYCHVQPVAAVTCGLEGEETTDICALASSQAAVRLFSDDGKCVFNARIMRDALRAAKAVNGVVAQHAQEPTLTVGAQMNEGRASEHFGLPGWPAVAEDIIIARDCVLAGYEQARLHVCHVSTAGAVEVIRWAKSQGWPVTAEVTPHHLILTEEQVIATFDPNSKVNPPLRTDRDVRALRQALIDGTIDAVATDHAPHPPHEKELGWCEAPMGMLGLETALAIVAELMVVPGRLTWVDVAERMSIRPAQIAGLGERFGRPIRVGEPANLCLIDPRAAWTVDSVALASRSRNTPVDGWTFSHRVVATLFEGRITHDAIGLASADLIERSA